MVSCGILRRAALVRTEVSEELSASFIRVTRIGELGTMLAVTSNRRTLQRNVRDHVSHPYRTTGKIIFLYILTVTFSEALLIVS
jgi:hypothetical protein